MMIASAHIDAETGRPSYARLEIESEQTNDALLDPSKPSSSSSDDEKRNTSQFYLGSLINYIRSKITPAMWQCIIILSFYVIGIIAYHHLEGWDLLDCVHFITVSCTTVGYGYFHPTNDTSRLFTMFFILVGVAIVPTYLSVFARDTLVGCQEYMIVSFYKFFYNKDHVPKRDMRLHKIHLSFTCIAFAFVVGTLFYTENESWDYIEGAYWTVTTMTSVGYGDLDVKYDSTRVFGIFFILICVFLYSAVVSNIFEVISDSNDNETATKHLKLSEEEWTELISKTFASENKTISKERLILDILLKKKIVSYSDTIKPIIEALKQVPHADNQHLSKKDVLSFKDTFNNSFCDQATTNPLLSDIYLKDDHHATTNPVHSNL